MLTYQQSFFIRENVIEYWEEMSTEIFAGVLCTLTAGIKAA
jgi:hypothetical protein